MPEFGVNCTAKFRTAYNFEGYTYTKNNSPCYGYSIPRKKLKEFGVITAIIVIPTAILPFSRINHHENSKQQANSATNHHAVSDTAFLFSRKGIAFHQVLVIGGTVYAINISIRHRSRNRLRILRSRCRGGNRSNLRNSSLLVDKPDCAALFVYDVGGIQLLSLG